MIGILRVVILEIVFLLLFTNRVKNVNQLKNDETSFQSWMEQYVKQYDTSSDEYRYRYEIWRDNVEFINDHNLKYYQKQVSFFVGMNQFGDLTNPEFNDYFLERIVTNYSTPSSASLTKFYMNDIPDSFDWRSVKGVVPNVLDQGRCTSSLIFVEGNAVVCNYAINTHNQLRINFGQLIACVSHGDCSRILDVDVFDYIAKCGAPTTGSPDRECHYDKKTSIPVINGAQSVISKNETDLAYSIYFDGPTTVAVDASQPSFRFYSGGIYFEPQCTNVLDHMMLAVGFGIIANRKYWIVQNTWGNEWGLQGYILMVRDSDNNCGIATLAKYPIYGTKSYNPDRSCEGTWIY